MTDHDQLFKQLLSTFFVEFLELFFPDVVAYMGIKSNQRSALGIQLWPAGCSKLYCKRGEFDDFGYMGMRVSGYSIRDGIAVIPAYPISNHRFRPRKVYFNVLRTMNPFPVASKS